VFSQGLFNCLPYDLLVFNNWFWHAKCDHSPKGQLEGIFLLEEIGPTEDEAKLKRELLLTGSVKR